MGELDRWLNGKGRGERLRHDGDTESAHRVFFIGYWSLISSAGHLSLALGFHLPNTNTMNEPGTMLGRGRG